MGKISEARNRNGGPKQGVRGFKSCLLFDITIYSPHTAGISSIKLGCVKHILPLICKQDKHITRETGILKAFRCHCYYHSTALLPKYIQHVVVELSDNHAKLLSWGLDCNIVTLKVVTLVAI